VDRGGEQGDAQGTSESSCRRQGSGMNGINSPATIASGIETLKPGEGPCVIAARTPGRLEATEKSAATDPKQSGRSVEITARLSSPDYGLNTQWRQA